MNKMSILDIDIPQSLPNDPRGDGPIIGKSGIPHRDTFDVLDSSKIQTFQDCPRKYFFQHILGWRPEKPNIHLVFGSAWHEAMEYLLNHDYSIESVQGAYQRFMKAYDEQFPHDWLEPNHRSKNPEKAMQVLVDYAKKWEQDHQDFDVLYTEVAGTAPISEEDVIHFKIDSVIQDPRGYWSFEHKTTGRNSQSWRNKWDLITQVGTYIHALYCAFPPEEVQGTIINGTVFKKNHEFLRIPVHRRGSVMAFWLWETNYYIDLIKRNMEWLAESSPSDDIMMAFPRNPQSCTKYSGCPYPDFCAHKCNPLQYQEEPPNGMRREFWDPRRNEEEANYKAKAKDDGSIEIAEKEEETNAKE